MAAADALRQALGPDRWPLPPEALPADAALVGGAVRDGLLGRLGPRPDLDLVVRQDAVALCRQLGQRHGGSTVVLDAERSIARLVLPGGSLDLARQAGESLESDLWRRDFRINALALPLQPGAAIVDPTGGLEDLVDGVLVAVREQNLLDDALRLLRGVRLAAELNFRLEDRTWDWIRLHHGRIAVVAPERVLQELEKLAACPGGGNGLAMALESGILASWLPAAARPEAALLRQLDHERARARGLTAAETAASLALARLATLFDADGLTRLRSSRQLQQRCARLRHWSTRLNLPDASEENLLCRLPEQERLTLHRQLEADLPALLLILPVAVATDWLPRWRDTDDALFHPRPPIDGRCLQDMLGLAPSPALGSLLEHLTLESAFGRIQGRDEALKAARTWLEGTST